MSYEEREAPLLPMLTMKNWHSDFKNKFIDYCFDCGEATTILLNGEDPMQLEQPPFEDIIKVKEQDGTERKVRKYKDNNDFSHRRFSDDDVKRWKELRNNKQKVMKLLVLNMSNEVRSKVTSKREYAEARAEYDLATIWKLVENTVVGR
jgi:hypothetical protein